MLAGVKHHLEPLGIETDDEVLAVSDDGDADTAGQRAPFSQLEDVFGNVRFLELATVFCQPILDQLAVGSSRRSVDLYLRHGQASRLSLVHGRG